MFFMFCVLYLFSSICSDFFSFYYLPVFPLSSFLYFPNFLFGYGTYTHFSPSHFIYTSAFLIHLLFFHLHPSSSRIYSASIHRLYISRLYISYISTPKKCPLPTLLLSHTISIFAFHFLSLLSTSLFLSIPFSQTLPILGFHFLSLSSISLLLLQSPFHRLSLFSVSIFLSLSSTSLFLSPSPSHTLLILGFHISITFIHLSSFPSISRPQSAPSNHRSILSHPSTLPKMLFKALTYTTHHSIFSILLSSFYP